MLWCYSILMNQGLVELSIDLGIDKKEETDKIFNSLIKNKEQIETSFGESLEWNKKEGRRICRIRSHSKIGGIKNTEEWHNIQDDMIDRMKRLEAALNPFLKKI